jgi:hypothetical protein
MKRIFGFFILSMIGFACSNDERNARLEIRLTDAPGDYEEVNIDIQGIEIHTEEGDQNSGWTSLDVEDGVYNLLDLSNGQDTLLALTELPAGRISQVRLILGENNTVKIDGVTKDLTTPSGQQSGLKLNIHADLVEGITYKLLLDFDAARSIVSRANGEYNLKPVIRTVVEAQSGAITGVVTPVESLPAVFAIVEDDTVATGYADETGHFLLRGVPAGTYTVSFDPKEGFNAAQKENVVVTIGSVTDVGTVDLQ